MMKGLPPKLLRGQGDGDLGIEAYQDRMQEVSATGKAVGSEGVTNNEGAINEFDLGFRAFVKEALIRIAFAVHDG